MKKVVVNKYDLSNSEIDRTENRVKILMMNSKKELLLCKINGVYNFVGGHIEDGESLEECAQREVMEETGIELDCSCFTPFLQLQQYEKNYYNSGRNYITTINFMIGKTDIQFDYGKRHLDNEEAEKDFQLDYIPISNIINELEANRENAKREHREFIIEEMEYVISEYQHQLLNNSKEDDDMER